MGNLFQKFNPGYAVPRPIASLVTVVVTTGLCLLLAIPNAKADTAIPTAITASYNAGVLTLTVSWSWNNPSDKAIGAAAFADLNGDGFTPGPTDNPATWTSGGNLVAGSTAAKNEFLGQLASSSIEGTASPFGDQTDNGIATTLGGFGVNVPRVLFPFGLANAKNPPLASSFTLTYTGLAAPPSHVCVVLYDIHTGNSQTTIDATSGNHSPISAEPNHNEDNSVEEGNGGNTVSCTDPAGSVDLNADLRLTKIVNNSTPIVGNNVVFTITVYNDGPIDATNVKVGDQLPSGYTYVSDNGAGAYNNGTGVWTVGTLNNGQSKSLQITATVLATGSYKNTAQVTASDQTDPDSTPNNNVATEDDQASVWVLIASGAATNVLCNGGTGKITLTMNGASPFDIAWNGPGANDGTANNQASGYMITNLPAGSYAISVTDDNGLLKTFSTSVMEPPVLSASATPTHALCNGGTGKITMTIAGGTPNYNIAWDGPGANDGSASNQTSGYMITNLPSGTYSITVTDANNCTKTTSATINQPTALSTSATPTDALCNGGAGKITMTISGGTPNYMIAWDGPGANDGSASNQTSGYMIASIPAGTYSVTVTDANGCTKTTSATVNQPTAISATATPTGVLCNGGNTGKITMALSGGTGLYDIAWDGPGANDGTANNQNSGYMITNLPTGNYSITVTDDNGCTKTAAAPVSEPAVLSVNAAPTSVLCNGGNTGKITMTLGGGASPYDIAWDGPGANDGTANNQNSGYMIANLPTGNYAITVTDDNGCTKTTSATVNEPAVLTVTPTPTAPLCNGGAGKITLTLGGGTSPYGIAWDGPGANDGTASNQFSGTMITNLPAGSYSITVTDNNGCTKTTSTTVMQPNALTLTPTPTAVLCNGGSTGKITVTVGGGTSPFDIAWDGPGANDGSIINQMSGYMIANLPAGTYAVTVTDDNGCSTNTSTTVAQPAALTASATPTNASCTGDTNGKITLTIGGGTTPYDISWNGPGANDGTANNQATGYMITNLPEGNYAITVTDDNGCTKTTSATISANPLPTCSISNGMGAVCPNSTGNQYSAPAGMDVYSWSISGNGSIPGAKNGQSVNVTAGASGSYTVNVTITKNGCSSTCFKQVMITSIPFKIVYTPEFCPNDPGPVIGLDGSEVGASYQLQTGGGSNIGAPKPGTGSPITFGTYPNGAYKVVITGGTCNGILTANVNASVGGCNLTVPDACTCVPINGYAEVTIKVNAPDGQTWKVKDVAGLYSGSGPYTPLAIGTFLTPIGGNMYTLIASRKATGFWVQVTNGNTDFDIMVGSANW